MTIGIGEVKVSGGKLVRVSLTETDHAWKCTIDGDFFTEGDAHQTLEDAQQLLQNRLSQFNAIYNSATERKITSWYHNTVRDLEPLLDGVIIGANADAIALATIRAFAHNRRYIYASGTKELIHTPHTDDLNADALKAYALFEQALLDFETSRKHRIHRQWQAAQHSEEEPNTYIDPADILARWHELQPEVVVDIPRLPEEQMQIETLWAQEVACGERPATLRIWDWAAPAVVCGAYQSIEDEVNLEEAYARGVHVVRRNSGGGAMYIEPSHTITFSLYAPLDFARGYTVAQSFHLCDAWLLEALRACGIQAYFSGLNDIAGPHGKIGGAAQKRVPGTVGCLLHHDTLAYDMDTTVLQQILNTSAEKMSDKAVKSAAKRVEPLRAQTSLTREQIVNQMVKTARSFGK